MPLNPIAALMYPFFLVPGLIFLTRVEGHRPARNRSIFRETATVVFASVGASATVLCLYVAVSAVGWKMPIETLAEFTMHPTEVFSVHPRATIVGLLVFLALASLVAWAAASQPLFDAGKNTLFNSGADVRANTAWQSVLMPESGDNDVLVGVQLKSGIWLQGAHDAHSDVAEHSSDQQLILKPPLHYRHKDSDELKEFKAFDRLVIRASEIDYLMSFERSS